MKLIFAIPVMIARAIGEVLFGTDDVTETLRAERVKAQIMMMTYRNY